MWLLAGYLLMQGNSQYITMAVFGFIAIILAGRRRVAPAGKSRKGANCPAFGQHAGGHHRSDHSGFRRECNPVSAMAGLGTANDNSDACDYLVESQVRTTAIPGLTLGSVRHRGSASGDRCAGDSPGIMLRLVLNGCDGHNCGTGSRHRNCAL